MFRNIRNRHLRQRFFGWIKPGGNDDFNISHLEARVKSEEKNLEGRRKAIVKYEGYATRFKHIPSIRDQSLEMANIEREAVPVIMAHIRYLKAELQEELDKANQA